MASVLNRPIPEIGIFSITFLSVESRGFEVTSGTIELYGNQNRGDYSSSNSSNSEALEFSENQPSPVHNRLICLLDVPAFMIPGHLIQYFAAYLSHIESIRILRHAPQTFDNSIDIVPQSLDSPYIALFLLKTSEIADNFMSEFNGSMLSSLESVACQLFKVKSVSSSLPRIRLSRGSSFDANGSFESINTVINSDESGLKSSGFSRSTSPVSNIWMRTSPSSQADISAQSLNHNYSYSPIESTFLTVDGMIAPNSNTCVVCLEAISESNPRSFTMFCNHVFHIDCIVQLEGPQCPVCRFEHDGTSTSLSECSICGYNGHGTSVASNNPRDLWVCLVCGFIGCGNSESFHIRTHYETHLHAYAINTDDGRVWDFAGDGYVHRLIISKSDPENEYNDDGSYETFDEGSNPFHPRRDAQHSATKVVEVANPRYTSHQRTLVAPLNSRQEDALIGRKLESIAFRYNNILRWQLESNREIYEQRLERLRKFASQEADNIKGTMTSNREGSYAAFGGSWAQCILSSLAQERAKLMRQIDNASAKLKVSASERDMLLQLNRSMMTNRLDWQAKIAEAKAKLDVAEKNYREAIPKLEKKVQELMEKLDDATHS